MASIEEALEELYGTDPSDFTKKRDAIVKELKKAGDKEGAAAVAARRKPTQIAYVLNQLSRKYPDAIADLVDVGRELAREQRRALRGEAGHGLRDSIERQRKAIGEAGKKAAAVMKELGVDPMANLQEVTMALQAALVDPTVGAALEEGRLEKAPAAAVGFGAPLPAASEEPPEHPPRAKPRSERRSEPPPRDELAERRKTKEAEEAAARRHAHAKSLAEAKAVLHAAESEAKKARKAADKAAAEAEEAKAAVQKAREAADAAAKEARRLEHEAEDAERTVAAAQKELTRLEANAPD